MKDDILSSSNINEVDLKKLYSMNSLIILYLCMSSVPLSLQLVLTLLYTE
ncbi:MAG: hypothetical protein RIS29_2842 [Bacteroidota bacterium]|jgi:hypothetical protein